MSETNLDQEQPPAPDIPPEQPKREVSVIPIDSTGRVVARNHTELLRYCGALIQGGGVPERFKTPQQLFGAIAYARELRLPDTAIRQIANIEGVMSIFGDLPLSLVQRSGDLTHFKEQWFDDDQNVICFENKNLKSPVYGSVTFISRGKGEIQSFSFTMDDARKAGLYPAKKRNGEANPSSPWEKYTAQMLRYRSRGLALKSVFADAINGVSIAEFDFPDSAPELTGIKDVTPSQDRDELAEKLAKRAEQHKGKVESSPSVSETQEPS